MPLSRNPRMDRRRRTIRESLSVAGDGSDEGRVSPSRAARQAEITEPTKKERGVAYSHSVRRACQQRLVQFIPVRKLSLTGVAAASCGLPIALMALHYLVFVTGTLDWSGHPMSALLNANSPRSLAAWLSSHLWLLCLGATVLTFRLRKHKLDDYEGEYRLWFWLVFTCLIGSIDSTTRLTELFGAALDRWSQVQVGWSGVAIVQATLATLIGMLALRLCTELKTVPTSLVLWLVGLSLWAGSAALSQSLFQLDMSPPVRSWLRASLWLGGLTAIWLCSLCFLRATFMEAQKRFLSRALTSANAVPWQQRVSEAMHSLPTLPRFGLGKKPAPPAEVQADQPVATRKKKVRPGQATSVADNTSIGTEEEAQVDREYGKKPGWFGQRKAGSTEQVDPTADAETTQRPPRRSLKERLTWSRQGQPENATATPHTPDRPDRQSNDTDQDAGDIPQRQRAWMKLPKPRLPKMSLPKMSLPKMSLPKMSVPKMSLPKMSLPKPRLPKLKLPSFRLPTPGEADSPAPDASVSSSWPAAHPSQSLPSTSSTQPDASAGEDQDTDSARGSSKAERKRLKRLQQENERRAA